jgi:hypothetical protein
MIACVSVNMVKMAVFVFCARVYVVPLYESVYVCMRVSVYAVIFGYSKHYII